jgi:drug/metabolite transporter (DMT)-like permease
MLVASLCFACMGVCVKLGAALFSSAELVFYRGLIATVLLFGLIRLNGGSLKTPHWKAQLIRGGTGFVSLVLYFFAIGALPLATAVTLNYTSPLFLALLLTFWSGEQLRRSLMLALAVGFAGVVLLLQPTLRQDQWLAAAVGLASGALAGVAYLNVRNLGELGEPEWRTVFYFSLIATLGGAPWVLAARPAHGYDARGIALLLGVGVFGALAQLAMTRAYRYGKTLVSASLAYSTVIFSSLFGVLIWKEVLPGLSWIGIALIIASGVIASLRSRASPAEQD